MTDIAARRLAIRNYYDANREKPPLTVSAELQSRWPDFSEEDLTRLAEDIADLNINRLLSPDASGSA
ncbi:hypothetical protein [Mesorhizobium silamurunense]|uniref:hypothetical protein n=1 Tax=Mesorhizobium silamurunense TaxID=499528 RepID=UPI00177C935C|nr:hypothetical protein [Mesorhizobium silamurunense]